MKLQVGKRYRMRNGAITGVMKEDPGFMAQDNPDRFYTKEQVDGFCPMWREDGRSMFFTSAGDEHGGYYRNSQEIITPGQSIYDIIAGYTE